jgi:hypothetical protein
MMRGWIAAVLFVATVVMLAVGFLNSPDQPSKIERDFREACAKVNGTAVWNNKYWECLK